MNKKYYDTWVTVRWLTLSIVPLVLLSLLITSGVTVINVLAEDSSFKIDGKEIESESNNRSGGDEQSHGVVRFPANKPTSKIRQPAINSLETTNILQQQKRAAPGEEQRFRFILENPAPRSGFDDGSNIDKMLRLIDKSIAVIPVYRAQVNSTTGVQQVQAKADAVRHLDSFRKLLDTTHLAVKTVSFPPSYINKPDDSAYEMCLYAIGKLYKGYRALDKTDPVLDELYREYISISKEQNERILQRASRYK